jgi:hypothetical protein
VVIKRSTSAEVGRLIETLLATDRVARETAAARLAIVGPRALERLSATLQGLGEETQLVAVLDVLERIGDARSAAVVEPLLQDRRESVVTGAIAVVRRALQADDAALAAQATDALVKLTTDRARSTAIRRAAGLALEDLPDDVIAPLRRSGAIPVSVAPEASLDSAAGSASMAWLSAWAEGGTSGQPSDIRHALNAVAEEAPLPLLHHVILRLRAIEAGDASQAMEWRTIRGLVHQMLAGRDSRVALYDLRETLEGDPRHLTVTMLAALSAIGDASCLETVARAWSHAHEPWLKDHLHDVFRSIVGREGVTRRHPAWKRVAAGHPQLTGGLSTPSQTRRSPRRHGRT